MDARRSLRPCGALLHQLGDIVFPRECMACGTHLTDAGGFCCATCLSAVRRVVRGDEQYREASTKIAAGGLVTDLTVGWYFEKEGVLQTLIHGLKYRGMRGIGEALGRDLGKLLLADSPGGCDALLPVPLHPSKFRERGYNQCDAIARGAASVTGVPVDDGILRRVRWTESQTTLGVEERRENVRGAFTVHPGRRKDVSGRRFMLVDDILTTGATLGSCAETLHGAGAAGICCCALALPL